MENEKWTPVQNNENITRGKIGRQIDLFHRWKRELGWKNTGRLRPLHMARILWVDCGLQGDIARSDRFAQGRKSLSDLA